PISARPSASPSACQLAMPTRGTRQVQRPRYSQTITAAQAASTTANPKAASMSLLLRSRVGLPCLLGQGPPQELRVRAGDRAGEPDQRGAAPAPVLAAGRFGQIERLEHELGHVRSEER